MALQTTQELLNGIAELIRLHVERRQQMTNDLLADSSLTLDEAVKGFERLYIERVLNLCNGDRQETARRLGIGYSTLKSKLYGWQKARRRARKPGRKKRRLDMTCRVDGCGRRSQGPRYGFICREHLQSLSRAQQAAARREWWWRRERSGARK